MEMISDDCIKELANAVIIRACQDYLDVGFNTAKRRVLEKFFFSGWFQMLSRGSVNPDAIIEYLQDEISRGNTSANFYYRLTKKHRNGYWRDYNENQKP